MLAGRRLCRPSLEDGPVLNWSFFTSLLALPLMHAFQAYEQRGISSQALPVGKDALGEWLMYIESPKSAAWAP